MTEHVPRLCPLGRSALAGVAVGRSLLETGQFQKAVAAVDQALRENPEVAEAQYVRGTSLYHLKEWTGAKKHLEFAVLLDEGHMDAWMALAQLHLGRRSPQKALGVMDRALALQRQRGSPDRAEAHLLRARILTALDRPVEAAAACRVAITHDRDSMAARYELGRLLVESGETEEAIRHLTTARELNPLDINTRLLLGDAWRARRDFARAMAEYRAAAGINRYDATPYVKLGELMLEQNARQEALQAFRLGCVVAPHDARLYFHLGRLYMNGHRYREATKMFERVRQLDPDLKEAESLLVEARAAAGRQGES